MIRFVTLLLLLTAGSRQVHAAVPPTLSFAEVEAGMRGTGRTVFRGTGVDTFDVEVLGKLSNIGPDQDLILARCSGGPLAETGILAGMSGSPVLIDGKLIGAIAYSWGFSKDAIAGITPIAEMLEIAALAGPPAIPRSGAATVDRAAFERLLAPERLGEFFSARLRALAPPSGLTRMAVPLTFAGYSAAGLRGVEPELRAAGFLPLQAGGAGASPAETPALEPGSALGLQLVRGDLEMTATGTVTWVDGDRVLAFGHPLFGLGAVDLPLTGATVQALLPSLQQSARIATPLAELGAVRQDRASGVLGLLQAKPRMIPVRVRFRSASGPEHTYSFDVADDPQLAPLLLYASLNGILQGKERAFGSSTVRLGQGSVIKMAGGDDVALDNVFAGTSAPAYGTGLPAYVLYLLLNNVWAPPQIAGVNLILEHDDQPRTATVRRLSLDRYSVRPGETLQATVVLRPYRGRDQVHTRALHIPQSTSPGRLIVHVGSALSVSNAEQAEERPMPTELEELVRLINRLRRNDQVYLVASREEAGILLRGASLPNLPPSATGILTRPAGRGSLALTQRTAVLDEAITTDYAVEGWARIELDVESE